MKDLIGGILAIVCSVSLILFAILILLPIFQAIETGNIFEYVIHLFVFGGFMFGGCMIMVEGFKRIDEGWK